jgi:hypothetical protein
MGIPKAEENDEPCFGVSAIKFNVMECLGSDGLRVVHLTSQFSALQIRATLASIVVSPVSRGRNTKVAVIADSRKH